MFRCVKTTFSAPPFTWKNSSGKIFFTASAKRRREVREGLLISEGAACTVCHKKANPGGGLTFGIFLIRN